MSLNRNTTTQRKIPFQGNNGEPSKRDRKYK